MSIHNPKCLDIKTSWRSMEESRAARTFNPKGLKTSIDPETLKNPLYIALHRLAPYSWHKGDNPYPGFTKLCLSFINNCVTWSAVRHWFTGIRPIPPDIALRIASILRSRAQGDIECAIELERIAADGASRPHMNRGFCEVKDRDGIVTDARGRRSRD